MDSVDDALPQVADRGHQLLDHATAQRRLEVNVHQAGTHLEQVQISHFDSVGSSDSHFEMRCYWSLMDWKSARLRCISPFKFEDVNNSL